MFHLLFAQIALIADAVYGSFFDDKEEQWNEVLSCNDRDSWVMDNDEETEEIPFPEVFYWSVLHPGGKLLEEDQILGYLSDGREDPYRTESAWLSMEKSWGL